MAEAGRHLWRSSRHPPSQAGSAKAGWAGPHPDSFWTICRNRDSTTPPGNLCQCSDTQTAKWFFSTLKFLLHLSKMFVSYFLLSCHWAPLINSLVQSTLNPVFQYFYTPMSCCLTGIDSLSSQSLLTNVNL